MSAKTEICLDIELEDVRHIKCFEFICPCLDCGQRQLCCCRKPRVFEVEDEANHFWAFTGECTYRGNIPYLGPGFRTGRMNLRGSRCKLHFFGVAEID